MLNESVQGFWTDGELDAWIEEAAIDISGKTLCYDTYSTMPLIEGVSIYTRPIDYLKLLGITHVGHGLKRTLPWMQGLQTAVVDGTPEYFYEIGTAIGITPTPTAAEHNTLVTLFYALTTNLISNIPLKFQTPAVLFTVSMGLIKERQLAKAIQLYTLYLSSLSSDRADVVTEKVDRPEPLNAYILKPIQQGQ
jgi:hypothetical protein